MFWCGEKSDDKGRALGERGGKQETKEQGENRANLKQEKAN